ncbi:MAG: ATPase, T2SS/T4P/T4SS family, partial [Candidatus Auribacterota bacterium]|nr:ATPase, T2SS/T4P/T4SS family [Candidatus Auribacterota bacterium]
MDLDFLHHLKDTNGLSKEQFEKIIQETRLTGESFLSAINKFGIIQEEEIIPVYAEYISFPFVLLKGLTIDDSVLNLIPAKYAFYYKVIPFKEKDGFLYVALTDPNNVSKLDELRLLVGYKLKPHLCGEKDIIDSLKEYYGVGAETVQSISENEEISRLDVPEKRGITIDEGEEASIIKFVNQILYEAYKDRATDIHIEPFEDELKIRYRIDGVLFDVSVPQYIKKLQESIISRIKVIAGMNIAEKRLPQDGRIELKIKDAVLDLRVSTLPTPYGETVSIRLLTERGKLFDLDLLGFSERDMTLLEKIISKPHGIVLLTGPTGSGKTTTLYSFLRKLNKEEIKILTIEDPIEYQLKGISQMQVQPQIGFSFVNALRFMLRHDPDIM